MILDQIPLDDRALARLVQLADKLNQSPSKVAGALLSKLLLSPPAPSPAQPSPNALPTSPPKDQPAHIIMCGVTLPNLNGEDGETVHIDSPVAVRIGWTTPKRNSSRQPRLVATVDLTFVDAETSAPVASIYLPSPTHPKRSLVECWTAEALNSDDLVAQWRGGDYVEASSEEWARMRPRVVTVERGEVWRPVRMLPQVKAVFEPSATQIEEYKARGWDSEAVGAFKRLRSQMVSGGPGHFEREAELKQQVDRMMIERVERGKRHEGR